MKMTTVRVLPCLVHVVLLCCLSLGYAESSIKRYLMTGETDTGPIDTSHFSTAQKVKGCIRCLCAKHCKYGSVEKQLCSPYNDLMMCSTHDRGSSCHHDTCTSDTHGTCYSVLNEGRQCVCHSGYTGKHCEITVSSGTHAPPTPAPTTLAPSNTLAPTSTDTELISRCITCHCTNQCDPTEQQKCSHYLSMIECSHEYSGYTCYADTCSGHGSCYHVDGVGRQCVCDQGHYGIHCELDHPVTFAPTTTHAPPTSTNAISTPTTSHVTSSTASPTTMTSSTVSDYCSKYPCGIHGKCTNTGSGYQCTCSPGWSGTNCEIDTHIDACFSNPCQNGGACLSIGTTFFCACTYGWAGTMCEKDASPTCEHRCVLLSVVDLQPVFNNGSLTCPDTSKASNEAFPMTCCGLETENRWQKGRQLMPHCSDFPEYTPIASFQHGRPIKDTAGIFLMCAEGGFKYIRQSCNSIPDIITINHSNQTDSTSFYVIY